MVNPAIQSLLTVSIAKASEANAEYSAVEQKISGFEARVQENQSKVNDLQTSITESQAKLDEVNKKIDDPPKTEKTEQVTTNTGRGKNAGTSTTTRTAMVVDQAELDKLKAEQANIKKEIDTAKAGITEAQTEATEATEKILTVDAGNKLTDFQKDKMGEVLDILDDSKKLAQHGYSPTTSAMNKLNRNISILEDTLDGGTKLEKEFWGIVTQDLEIIANADTNNYAGNSHSSKK